MIAIIRNNNTNSRNSMKAPRASVGINPSYQQQQIPIVEGFSNGEIQSRRRITSCCNNASSFQGQPQTTTQNYFVPPQIPNQNSRSSSHLEPSHGHGFSRTNSQNPLIVQPSELSPQRRTHTSSIETTVFPAHITPLESQQQLFRHRTADKIKGQQFLWVPNLYITPHSNIRTTTFQSLERRSSNRINSHQEVSQYGSSNCVYPQQSQEAQFHCNSQSSQESQQQQIFSQQEKLQFQQNQDKGQLNLNRVIMQKQANQPQSEAGSQKKQQKQQQQQQLLELQQKNQRIGLIPQKYPQIDQQQQQQSFYQHQNASLTPVLKPITNQMNCKDILISQNEMNQSKADQLCSENRLVQSTWRYNYPTQSNHLNARLEYEQEYISSQKDQTNLIGEDRYEQQCQQLEYARKHQLERTQFLEKQEIELKQAEIHSKLLCGDNSFLNTKLADQYKEMHSQIVSGNIPQQEKLLLIPGQNKESIQEVHDYWTYLNNKVHHHPQELVQQYKTSEGKVALLRSELEKCKQDIDFARIEGEIRERKSLEVKAMKDKLRLEHERLIEDYAILKDYNQRLCQQNEQFKGQLEKQGSISGMVWPVQQSEQKYDLKHTEKGNQSESKCKLVENDQKCENDKVDAIPRDEKYPEKENNHKEIGNTNNKIMLAVSFQEQQESSRQLVADFQDISLLKEEFYPEIFERPLPPLPNYCSISSCSDSSENNLHNINCNNSKLIASPSAIFRVEGDSRYSTLFSQLNDSQFSMPLTPSVNLPMVKSPK